MKNNDKEYYFRELLELSDTLHRGLEEMSNTFFGAYNTSTRDKAITIKLDEFRSNEGNKVRQAYEDAIFHNNSLYDFRNQLAFRAEKLYPDYNAPDRNEQIIDLLTLMLQMFILVKSLADESRRQPQEKYLLYRYYRICKLIRLITGEDDCQFVWQQGSEVVPLVSSDIFYYDTKSHDSVLNQDYTEPRHVELRSTLNDLSAYIAETKKQSNDKINDKIGKTAFLFKDNAFDERKVMSKYKLQKRTICIRLDIFPEDSLNEEFRDPITRDEDGGKNEEVIYLFLEKYFKEECETPEPVAEDFSVKDVLRLSNVLYLTESISNMFRIDRYKLLEMRHQYSMIMPRGNNKEGIRILHLSDLHIDKKIFRRILKDKELFHGFRQIDKQTRVNRNSENLCYINVTLDGVSASDTDYSIDFLILTGDVVNTASTASALQENYHRAQNIITEIVLNLWGCEEKKENEDVIPGVYMIQDWKKRVIIVPGNHDYASMNELEAINKERAIRGGVPSYRSSEIIVRFPYYVHFVGQLLDIDINLLVQNGLNEFRQYENMKINFYCLSNSSDASAQRTQKVSFHGLDTLLAKTHSKSDFSNVVVSHYHPNYPIKYVNDRYHDERFLNENDVYAAEYRNLCEGITEFSKDAIQKLESLRNHKAPQAKKITAMGLLNQMDRIKNLLEETIRFLNKLPEATNSKKKDNDPFLIVDVGRLVKLYQDAAFQYAEEGDTWQADRMEYLLRNEEVIQFLANVNNARSISELDDQYFKNSFKMINTMIENNKPTYLSGHEHKFQNDMYNNEKAFGAPRLWAANRRDLDVTGFYGQIIKIPQDGSMAKAEKLEIKKIP